MEVLFLGLAGAECGPECFLHKVGPFLFVMSFSMSDENKLQSSQHDVNISFHPVLSFKHPHSFISRA